MKPIVHLLRILSITLSVVISSVANSYGTIFLVDNTANTDDLATYTLANGTNTLRKCIRLANANAGLDTINFNLPGAGPFIIPVTGTTLLTITGPVLIDGFTQPSASAGNLLVQLNGTGAINVLLLNPGSDGSTIRGLVIYGNGSVGIRMAGSGSHTISGNYIGTNSAGTAIGAATALQYGIVGVGATNCTIGGSLGVSTRNLISGNTTRGILLSAGSNSTSVVGNYIGVNSAGTAALGSSVSGIEINASTNCTIGGSGGAATRNIISGHSARAIYVQAASHFVTIQSNYIGLNSTGAAAISNGNPAVEINASTNPLIGGSGGANTGNVISGNAGRGIYILAGSNSPVIRGNYIGVNALGTAAIANTGNPGIEIAASANATIGGTGGAATLNLISGNGGRGIILTTGSNTATIQGNYIGVDLSGTTAVPNGNSGIELNASTNCLIASNLISGNSGRGIYALAASHSPVIQSNSIGINATGIAAIPNTNSGIEISASTNPLIGGPSGASTRNLISGNAGRGIYILAGSNSPVIQGNYIGVNATGTAAIPNTSNNGIDISASTNALIGGTSGTATRNLISGNGQKGIFIQNGSNTATVQGNYIGVDVTGVSAIGNSNHGVDISGSTSCLIGGLGGVSTRNIISGNLQRGVNIQSLSHSTTVQGNYIGVNTTGNVAVANTTNGIEVNNSNAILIGGTSYSARNIISGNTQSGLYVTTCDGLTIKGNFIGVGLDGTTSLGNKQNGMNLTNPTSNVVIGGATHPERNIISNNTNNGIQVSNSTTISIQNNYIGVDSTGTVASGNLQSGINLTNATNLIIGGSSYNLRNIISANTQKGVGITNAPGTIFKGNFVGVPLNGASNFGNKQQGVTFSNSPNSLIGGTVPEERNIISHNTNEALIVTTSNASLIVNNYIGTDSTGMLVAGNGGRGVSISNSLNVTVGGSTALSGNIISNNGSHGIAYNGTSSYGIIKGNIIGLGIDGTTPMQNRGHGIELSASFKAIVGGTTLLERNLIANSLNQGIQVSSSDSITIQGNYVGVDVTGLLNRGNVENGINISTSKGVVVGGSGYSPRNIVSGNGQDGIRINGNCPGAIIKGNICGLGKDGSTILSNVQSGIHLAGSNSDGAMIGGSSFDERNISSSNGTTLTAVSRDGIRIDGNSNNHIIKGNYCGVDSTGTLPRGNYWAGISLNECKNVLTGGTGPFEGNICSDNFHEGMYLRNDTNCVILGNYIGTDKTGLFPLGNHDWGINVRYRSYLNTIGGTDVSEGNIIAYTNNIGGLGSGVFVDTLGSRNKITRNKIYCNAERGINIAVSANEGILAPVISTSDINYITGTGSIDGDSIHVYLNIKSGGVCDCEGETYLGATTVSGGTWTFTHNLGLSLAETESVTATETTAGQSTSNFSDCYVPLPVTLISFTATKYIGSTTLLSWATASEQNNKQFEVQRSTDGIHFETIAIVAGHGTTNQSQQYSVIDPAVSEGTVYFRLKQVDLDGQFSYSKVVALDFSKTSLSLIQNEEGIVLTRADGSAEELRYKVYSMTGALVTEGRLPFQQGIYFHQVALRLSTALYMVAVFQGNDSLIQKLYVK